MGLRTNFSRNLRKIRVARGLSQEDVALEASVNRTYLSDLERELYSASLDVVDRIAKALDVDPLELLEPEMALSRGKTLRRAKGIAKR